MNVTPIKNSKFEIKNSAAGFSFVEVIVVSTIVTLVFGGLLAGVQLMIELIGHSKAESGAQSLAVAKVEYIRSLPYADVGTVDGIPAGSIPQTSTTTLNGITYTEDVLVQYLDRPEDGFGTNDENDITEDSKVVKVTYSWNIRGEDRSFEMVTDIIPKGIESTSGGGTLFINVFDAEVQPVSGADVHVYNDTGTSTIDVTVETNADGIANFPGTPALSGYQITATKSGYSTDQTYSASSTNSDPNPPHVSVLKGEVSTVNFAIDALSDLTLQTREPAETNTFTDDFVDASNLSSQTDTSVSSGALVLAGSPGSYPSSGTARSVPITPSALASWESFDFTASSSADTEARVQLYSVSGSGTSTSYTLVPDEDLASNSTGFVSGPIDISGLDTSTYDSLALGAELSTSDANETPQITDWELTHVTTQQPIGGVTVGITGDKTIGENNESPVPKFDTNVTTDGSGDYTLSGIEWDTYSVDIPSSEGYDIAEVTPLTPLALDPGVSEDLRLILVPDTTNSLRVAVTDTSGNTIADAEVELTRTGFSETQETSLNGQVFFSDLASHNDYSITVTADSYATFTQNNVTVDGDSDIRVEMTSS